MELLWAPLRILMAVNGFVLRIGRHLAWIALALMVVAILIQVVFRYVLNNALPWPDEASRFLMLWMTGLIAPSAYRWGGFVAIDMVPRALPRRTGAVLALVLLVLSLLVLVIGVQLGLRHVASGCLFNSSTLYVPFRLQVDWLSPCDTAFFAWEGFGWARVKLAWMYLSLLVGLVLMVMVSVELILRAMIVLHDPAAPLLPDPEIIAAGAD